MAIVYRTPGAWGTGKGTNLTNVEVDENFWQLVLRLIAIETNPPTAIGIANIQVIGSQFKIILDDATEFGPYALPIAQFKYRGDWQNDMTYFPFDNVTVPGFGLFMVLVEHATPVLPGVFDPNLTVGGLAAYLLVYGDANPGAYHTYPAIEHAAFGGV